MLSTSVATNINFSSVGRFREWFFEYFRRTLDFRVSNEPDIIKCGYFYGTYYIVEVWGKVRKNSTNAFEHWICLSNEHECGFFERTRTSIEQFDVRYNTIFNFQIRSSKTNLSEKCCTRVL